MSYVHFNRGNGGSGRGQYSTENQVDKTSQPMEKTELDQPEDGIMTTTVGHVGLISSIQVKHANISKTQQTTRRKQHQKIQ
jgi:hypothetical protein